MQIESQLPGYEREDTPQTNYNSDSSHQNTGNTIQTIRTLSYRQLDSVPTPMPVIKVEKIDDYSIEPSIPPLVPCNNSQQTGTVPKPARGRPPLKSKSFMPTDSIQSSQYQLWKNSQFQGMDVHAMVKAPPVIQNNPHVSSKSLPSNINIQSIPAARAKALASVTPDQIKQMAKAQIKDLRPNEGKKLKEVDVSPNSRKTEVKQYKNLNTENILSPNQSSPSTLQIVQGQASSSKNSIYLPNEKIAEMFQKIDVVNQVVDVQVKKRGRGRPPLFQFQNKKANVKSVHKIPRTERPSLILERHATQFNKMSDMNVKVVPHDKRIGVDGSGLSSEASSSRNSHIEIEEAPSGVQIITEPDTGQVFTVRTFM